MNRDHIKGAIVGALAVAILVPLATFAARTATPLVASLFPANQVYANLPAPVLSLPAAPGPNVNPGLSTSTTPLSFVVTATDGQGETVVSNVVATTTAASSTLQLTWPAVTGAQGYNVYFSTSSPASSPQFLQRFAATSTSGTPNAYYTLTSTSSPVFVTGLPTSNTAYAFNAKQSTGIGWFLGNFGIGTSSPQVALDVASGTMRAFSNSTSTCAAINDGAVFYNSKDFHLYVCEQSTWQLIK
jgi:hypothetical protein